MMYLLGDSTYKALGGFLITISVLGGVLNGFVVLFFFRLYKREGRLINLLICSTATSDLLPSIFAYPLAALRTLQRNPYSSKNVACKLEGFCIHMTALSSVIHLAAMAYERYSVIKSGTSKIFSVKRQYFIVAMIWIYSLSVSIMPFCGWSSYEPEGIQTSCTVNWKSNEAEDVSYSGLLLFTNFIFPFGVIVFSYVRLYKYVRTNSFAKQWSDSQICRDFWRKRMQKNKALAVMVFVLIAMFLATWTPYVVISMYNLIGAPDLNPLVETIPAIFAKSFTILNPLVYGIKHHKFRAEIKRLYCLIFGISNKDSSKIMTSECSGDTICVPSTELRNSTNQSNMNDKHYNNSKTEEKPVTATTALVESDNKEEAL